MYNEEAPFYKLELDCKNCDTSGEIAISKGVKFEDVKCPNCGCKTLIKKDKITY